MGLEITDAYRSLFQIAHAHMTEYQDRLRDEHNLNEWPRYDWDQESSSLIFSDLSGPKVAATVEFVGSISTRSNTWLWSWANDSHMPEVKSRIERVREYGVGKSLPQLTTDMWPADEVDGWEMTSIAGYTLGAKGSYRTPSESGFTYMLIMDIRWVT